MPRLRRSDCSQPGIRRRGRGRGFEYLDGEGRSIRDDETLERIRSLAVPPAWRNVWICVDPWGHLQAVGIDAAGRKQYRYHPLWRERKDREKFDRMLEFARLLPNARRTVERRLRDDRLSRERVLACAIRLIDRGFFRLGGEEYAEENETYGIATILREHVQVGDGGLIVFDYPSKGGKRRVQTIVDPLAHDVVAALKRRRSGTGLLAYRNGRWVDVRGSEVNEYLKEIAGPSFTAKDFRTWHATVLAAVALAVAADTAQTKTGRARAVRRASEEVAHYLGNTPAVARGSYIDPRVVDRFYAGVTIAPSLDALGDVDAFGAPATQGEIEAAVIDLLDEGGALRKAA
jgi:DNA topoisomerase I